MHTRNSTEFERLAQANMDALYTRAIHITQNTPQAEALVQSTFSRAYSRFDSFDHRMRFRDWLFQILESHSNSKVQRNSLT